MIKSAALLALAALASTASAETVTSTVFPGAQMTADLLFSGSKLVGYRATIPDFDALSYLPNAGMPVQRVKFPEHPQNPFNHLEVDFNPFGHPGGFTRDRMFEILATNQTLLTEESPYFLVPHFDFHFQIPTAEYVEGQMTCDTFPPCAGGNVALFHIPPPAGFIPDSFYYDVTADVPAMGAHWEDNNLAFTKANGLFLRQPALIYGSFNGELTFYENMASLECLRGVKNGTETVDFAFDTPRYFARAGNYPTRSRITYDSAASVYHIDFYNAEYECAGVDCAVANCGCKNVEASSSGKSVSIDFVDSSVATAPCQ